MHLLSYLFFHTTVATALSLALTTASLAADYTYDQLHRLTRTTYPTGYRLDYRYDAAGNLQEIITSQVTLSQVSHLVLGTTNHQVLVRSPTGVLEYQFPLSQSGTEIALATLDSDQDHTSEVAVADGPSVTLSELNGNHPLTLPVAELSATVAVGDLNQDGQPELVVASQVVNYENGTSSSLEVITRSERQRHRKKHIVNIGDGTKTGQLPSKLNYLSLEIEKLRFSLLILYPKPQFFSGFKVYWISRGMEFK
jgi:YD repeat-containing protein